MCINDVKVSFSSEYIRDGRIYIQFELFLHIERSSPESDEVSDLSRENHFPPLVQQ